jgi:uncharacterized protein YqfB (UPF0267 family)
MKSICLFILLFVLISSCDNQNHIEKYNINLSELKTLPQNFYGYRRGSVYLEDLEHKKYRLWFHLEKNGNIKNIFRIDNLQNLKDNSKALKTFKIDTINEKRNAQKFIELSRKFKFGHIRIDTINKTYFSSIDGLSEEFIKTFNDSVTKIYSKDKEFRLLKNGWFEKIKKRN